MVYDGIANIHVKDIGIGNFDGVFSALDHKLAIILPRVLGEGDFAFDGNVSLVEGWERLGDAGIMEFAEGKGLERRKALTRALLRAAFRRREHRGGSRGIATAAGRKGGKGE